MTPSATEKFSPRIRNDGYIGPESRKNLAGSRVAIAGVGGVGGELAFQLACLGVGSLAIADPDIFDISNLNRQRGASISTLGKLKVYVLAGLVTDHDPSVEVRCFPEGVTSENLNDFLAGVDLVVEATDYRQPGIGSMIAREAASRGIPVLVGAEVGWGVTATLFEPGGYSYERFFGLDKRDGEIRLSSLIGHIPHYADIRVLAAVQNGLIQAPALISAVATCGATLSSMTIKRLTKVGDVITAPRSLHIDAHGPTKHVIRWRGLHYWMSVLHCAARCKLGLNEKMDF